MYSESDNINNRNGGVLESNSSCLGSRELIVYKNYEAAPLHDCIHYIRQENGIFLLDIEVPFTILFH